MKLVTAVLLLSVKMAAGQALGAKGLEVWPVPIEQRVFAGSFARDRAPAEVRLTGCRNEYGSAQLAVRTDRDDTLSVTASALRSTRGGEIAAEAVRVRFGAYLPVDETGQFTADPLLEQPTQALAANIAQPVWITIHIPKATRRDSYVGELLIKTRAGEKKVTISVEVLDATLPDPTKWSFYLNVWQDPNGIARAHKVPLWSEDHWRLIAAYGRNLAEHGCRAITTSILHDPWNSQTGYEFPAMVEWRYPGEWKKGGASRFEWDFRIFDRYVATMIESGVKQKIEMFAMVKGPGPTPDASIRYLDTVSKTARVATLTANDEMWREAWAVFLPALKRHLQEKGWWQISYLGFDEKPAQIMEGLFEFMDSAAPDFKLILSGGHAGKRPNCDLIVYWDELLKPDKWKQEYEPMVREMRAQGRQVSFYTACEPRYPNLFLYSSLREARMLPWAAIKYNLSGYLHWAVHAFPDNLWTQPNYKWHSGDMFLQYPGASGPLDGMRWELLRQGIQDHEALRIAREMTTFWGREDLTRRLDTAVETALVLDSCRDIPRVEQARATVNEVLREIGSPDEMGKKSP